MSAKRGGSGNPPHVRLYDGDVVEVYWQGGWEQAVVEDFRTVSMEFEPQFLLAVTEGTGMAGSDETITVDATPCGAHSCLAGPDCDGYRCDDCGWECPNGPDEG